MQTKDYWRNRHEQNKKMNKTFYESVLRNINQEKWQQILLEEGIAWQSSRCNEPIATIELR